MFDLMKGDCLELMEKIPDGSVDMVLTDPPYGICYQSHRRKSVYDRITNDDSVDFLPPLFGEMNRILKNNTAVYCFCSWHNVDVFKMEFEKVFTIKNILIWAKSNHGSGDLLGSYAPRYEMILYGTKGRRVLEGKRTDDIIYADKTQNRFHPTEKPVRLLERIIAKSSAKGDSVFDPFMGSGSTGVACVNTGRDFIGIEKEEKYYEIAQKRIMEARLTK